MTYESDTLDALDRWYENIKHLVGVTTTPTPELALIMEALQIMRRTDEHVESLSAKINEQAVEITHLNELLRLQRESEEYS